jgi:hypothetical protein
MAHGYSILLLIGALYHLSGFQFGNELLIRLVVVTHNPISEYVVQMLGIVVEQIILDQLLNHFFSCFHIVFLHGCYNITPQSALGVDTDALAGVWGGIFLCKIFLSVEVIE